MGFWELAAPDARQTAAWKVNSEAACLALAERFAFHCWL